MSVGRGVVSTVGLVFAPIVALYVLNVDTHPLARPANVYTLFYALYVSVSLSFSC